MTDTVSASMKIAGAKAAEGFDVILSFEQTAAIYRAMLAASPQEEDGWITHDGGPNPVPGKMVEVCYRNGETETRTANRLGWDHWEQKHPAWARYDIIAYRVTEGVKP